MAKLLTVAQKRCIARLKPGTWLSAYELQVSLGTTASLVQRGLLESRSDGLGTMFSPRTARQFRLTTAGEQERDAMVPSQWVGLNWHREF